MTALTYYRTKGSQLTTTEADDDILFLANAAPVSVKNSGAVGDGATDDSAAFASAVAVATNGTVVFVPPGTYKIATGFTMPNDKTVHLVGAGAKLLYTGTGTCISINNGAISAFGGLNEPKHVIFGLRIVANTTGSGTAIQIQDSTSQTVRNCTFSGFNKGVELKNYRYWTEQTVLDTLDFFNCNSNVYHGGGQVFDGSSASIVSTGSDTIVVTGHPWSTADSVQYHNGGGSSITGLTSGTTYYVIKVDANTLKLATTAANASAGTAIDLTAVGTGTTHKLGMLSNASTHYSRVTVGDLASTVPATTTFDGSSASVVSLASDTITIPGHAWQTGQIAIYSSGAGVAITGLTTTFNYYVIKVDANTVKLALSMANAIVGTGIDLTGLGTGTSHSLTALAYGVFIETGISIYRSRFDLLNIFPNKTSANGFYCDGDLKGVTGAIHFESSSVSTNKAITLDLNCSSPEVDLVITTVGTIVQPCRVVPSAVSMQGWRFINFGNGTGSLRKAGALTYVRAIYQAGSTTIDYAEQVTTGDVVQMLSKVAAPVEVRSTLDATKFSEWRHNLTGAGASVTFSDNATTQDVTGLNAIRFNNASAGTNMVSLTGGKEGQFLTIYFSNTNTALLHSNTADRFMNSGSATVTPGGNESRVLYRMENGRWYQQAAIVNP